jgi:hypothetical protein
LRLTPSRPWMQLARPATVCDCVWLGPSSPRVIFPLHSEVGPPQHHAGHCRPHFPCHLHGRCLVLISTVCQTTGRAYLSVARVSGGLTVDVLWRQEGTLPTLTGQVCRRAAGAEPEGTPAIPLAAAKQRLCPVPEDAKQRTLSCPDHSRRCPGSAADLDDGPPGLPIRMRATPASTAR